VHPGRAWRLQRTATGNKIAGREECARPSLSFPIFRNLFGLYGGEGGIRTPDTLASMPDFESENWRAASHCMAAHDAGNY
jgi:hypothetical protein